MRRIVTSLAVLGALALGACSGGGSVLNTGTTQPERTIVTVLGQVNDARVLQGSSIALSASAVRGPQNGVLSTNQFRWSAALVTSGSYTVNALGTTKPCGVVNTIAGGVSTPYAADFSIYIAIDPTNEANIIFFPPAILPAPAGTAISLPGATPYCVVISATPVGGSAANAGSITVAVVSPTAPLN